MTGPRRALIAAVGVVLIAIAVTLALTDDHSSSPGVDAAIIAVVLASWIGTGLFAWSRRPRNRVGALMVGVGFAFFFIALQSSDAPLVHTIGLWLSSLFAPAAVHMLLAFPSGRLIGRPQRVAVVGFYALALLVPLGILLFRRDCECGVEDAPRNLLLIRESQTAADAIEIVGSLIGAVATIAVAAILVRRWRTASPAGRRALSPVLWTGATMVGALGVHLALDRPGEPTTAGEITSLLMLVAFAAVPFAFLVGLARSHVWRAGAMADVLGALGESRGDERMQRAIAEAIGDPSLQVAYWLPDREQFVDLHGRPVALPDGGGRAAITVEREGHTVGALIYDPAATDEPEMVRAVGNAAALALENARLDAEVRARVEELSASRQRLLEVGMAERRRLERDLHDGAQQRLVSLSLQLGLVGQKLDTDPQAARALLAGARDEARAALEDLRELARGIHPAILTDRGLGAALASLADRAPLPVDVAGVPEERLPAPVEAAAYFVVAESLTNVSKYANASHAEVRVDREHGFALIEVRDDGVGGADPAAGSGLRGLADRLAALDGRLEIDSEPGRGTTVRARVPCPA